MKVTNDDLVKKIRASHKALSKELYLNAEQAPIMLDLLRAHEAALDAFKTLEQTRTLRNVSVKAWYCKDKDYQRTFIMGWDFMKHHGDAKPGRPFGEADFDIERTHTMVKEVFYESADFVQQRGLSSVLEAAYIAMQGENWSPNGEARPLIQKLGLKHTTMCVGDVMQVAEKFYFVDSIGFIDMDTGKTVER